MRFSTVFTALAVVTGAWAQFSGSSITAALSLTVANKDDAPKYTPTFQNLTGATQDSSFQTFRLVDTIAAYHDVNGKDGSPLLTCSFFTQCLTASTADYVGGETQPSGLTNFITDSNGYCKETPS
ncbi:hypothetical protein K438DRAFT_1965755 [Mycena galopus ATCC 62051]|nr:hypothetical protein K438DRAFT_1965755 [Mycena galopus ATCC 62051]